MTSMTSRERVKRAIERKPHDRVPRYESIWGDTLTRWAREGLVDGFEGAHKALGVDLRNISKFIWPSPWPERMQDISQEGNTRLFKDEWGATLRLFTDRQTTPEHIGWECDGPDAWYNGFRQRIIDAEYPIDMQACRDRFALAQTEQKWTYLTCVEPFEVLRKLIGDEETMVNIKEEPEWIADMAEVTTTRTIRTLARYGQAGLPTDGLWIYGDMAFNHATFCSPDDYRELIWPQHKRLADWAHANGMKVIFHTDGNVNAVIGHYIEAGFDILQPLECKARMDIRTLIPQYGDRLSFFGNIDVMVLIRGNLEEIENEVRCKIEAGKQNNGYIYHSDHSIPPQVSWETYQAIIRMVDRHGNYR